MVTFTENMKRLQLLDCDYVPFCITNYTFVCEGAIRKRNIINNYILFYSHQYENYKCTF